MSIISNDIEHAIELLTRDELVAIPTETVYGLAGNALSTNAVVKIFQTKNRPSFDPLIVHTSSLAEASKFADVSSARIQKLANALSPGPITFILPKKNNISDLVTSGHDTVGIRIPNHPLTFELLSKLPFPVAAPSANPFGFTSPTTANHVNDQLGEKLSLILDGGPSSVGLESTIVKDTKKGILVLRLGGISIETVEEVLGEKVVSVKTSSSNPTAPGMLSSHYNPGTPVLLGNIEENYKFHKGKRIAAIAFQQLPSLHFTSVEILSPNGNLNEAASNLFKALRNLGKTGADIILAEPVPDKGLGKAINDRLQRASV